MEHHELIDKLWKLFRKIPDKDKIKWLLEFGIPDIIDNWDDELLIEEISQLQEKAKVLKQSTLS